MTAIAHPNLKWFAMLERRLKCAHELNTILAILIAARYSIENLDSSWGKLLAQFENFSNSFPVMIVLLLRSIDVPASRSAMVNSECSCSSSTELNTTFVLHDFT